MMLDQNDKNVVSPFPDILASKETKASEEYGKQYAKAMWGTYLMNAVQYNLQRQRDVINRQYAEGFESIEKYKTLKGIPNTSYLNLDFSPVNFIATTVDKIVGRMTEVGFKIQCNSIDPESKNQYDDLRNEMMADMFLKPYSDGLEQRTGTPLVPKGKFVAQSDEEIELHMTTNYKDDLSIAMEKAFNFVFSSNMFEQTREKVLRDLVVLKRAVVRRSYDRDWNIRIEYDDAVDLITPYSKYDDFHNIPWDGVIKSFTIGEIAMMKNFTDEQLYNIARECSGKNNNPAWAWGMSYDGYYRGNQYDGLAPPYYNFNIQVLDYEFLGLDKTVYEYKVSRRRKKFKKIKASDVRDPDAEYIERDIENLYQGLWIINSEYIIKHELARNVPREKIKGSYSPNATLSRKIIAPGIYDMKNKSHVERMIPHEDAINLANLAFQTMLIKAKPPGVAVDVRGLMDAAKAMGGESMKPIDVLKIYEQTGNLIFSSITEENDVINNRVITELRGGVSDAFRSLMEVMQFRKQLIYEVVGINPNIDPGVAKPDVGLGVQDNAIQATNDSLRPLYNAHLRLVDALAKETGLMIQDCIEEDNEAFMNAIGAYSTKVIEVGKKLALVQMGIKVELLPDDKEKQSVEQLLQMGMQSQPPLLTASDAIRVRSLMKQDVKGAERLLVFLENKNRKDAQEAALAQQQQTGDIQVQSAQAAAQASMQAEQQKLQLEQQRLQMEYQLKNDFEEAQFQRQMKLQQLKNEGLYTVAEIGAGSKVNVQQAANEGKVVAQHVANEGKEQVEHLKHESNMNQLVMDSTLNPPEKKQPVKK